MADANHYRDAAAGLEKAAKAFLACADEYDDDDGDETPREKQPKDLNAASAAARDRLRQARRERE